MKHFTLCMVALTVMALSGAAFAEQNEPEEPLRLELDLVDGSHITGIPDITAVSMRTSYAKMDLLLKDILTIKIADEQGTAAIKLQNGAEDSHSGPLPSNSAPIAIGGNNFQAYHHPWIGDVEQIRQQAIKSDMITMKQDGLAKVTQGVTTLEDVLRVC